MPAATGRGRQVRQGLVQVAEGDGFGEVTVHAGFEAALAVAFHGVGRQRDDRQAAAGAVLSGADAGGRLEAVHAGHLQVHQHGVERLAAENGHGFCAVGDHHGGRAEFADQGGRQPLEDRVVLGDEHP